MGISRRLVGRVLAFSFLFLLLTSSALLAAAWRSLGKRVTGARAARVHASPQWRDGAFRNPQPMWNDVFGALSAMAHASPAVAPDAPVPVARTDRALFTTPPASGLRVTWLGHAMQLVEIDGVNVLTDPLLYDNASPFTWAGPQRWFHSPLAAQELPPIDAVVISHDHYDHLQRESIEAMSSWPRTVFVVPLGVGAHLEYWGIPQERIVELDWWERTQVATLTVVCTPVRHASGRQLFDQNSKLWASYALLGTAHRVFFSGDTGLFPALRDIGEKLGPFDLTMIEIGEYNAAWPDWHLGPEQAVRAHTWLRGRLMLPIHWATLELAPHGWTEPAERVLVAAAAAQVDLILPKPGQSVEPIAPPPFERWWPDAPWTTAAQAPIVARGMD